MGLVIEIGLGLLVAYWLSDAVGIPMIWAVIAVVGIWFLVTRGKGLSGAGAGVFNGVGNIFRGVYNFVVAYAVYTGVMMIATRVIGISNNYATAQFQALGWRPWLWPQHIALDLLLWTCVAFIATWAASKAADGNWQIAGAIFGVSAIVIFMIMWFPRWTEEIRPKPTATMPKDATKWQKTDQALAERGVLPVAGDTTWRFGLGKPDPEHGAVGGSVRRLWHWSFGPPAPPSPAGSRTSPPAVVYVASPARAEQVAPCSSVSATTPWTVTMNCEFNIESDGPIDIEYSGHKVHFVPGQGLQKFPQPNRVDTNNPNSDPKVFTDPNDPNGHVRFRLYPVR